MYTEGPKSVRERSVFAYAEGPAGFAGFHRLLWVFSLAVCAEKAYAEGPDKASARLRGERQGKSVRGRSTLGRICPVASLPCTRKVHSDGGSF